MEEKVQCLLANYTEFAWNKAGTLQAIWLKYDPTSMGIQLYYEIRDLLKGNFKQLWMGMCMISLLYSLLDNIPIW